MVFGSIAKAGNMADGAADMTKVPDNAAEVAKSTDDLNANAEMTDNQPVVESTLDNTDDLPSNEEMAQYQSEEGSISENYDNQGNLSESNSDPQGEAEPGFIQYAPADYRNSITGNFSTNHFPPYHNQNSAEEIALTRNTVNTITDMGPLDAYDEIRQQLTNLGPNVENIDQHRFTTDNTYPYIKATPYQNGDVDIEEGEAKLIVDMQWNNTAEEFRINHFHGLDDNYGQ